MSARPFHEIPLVEPSADMATSYAQMMIERYERYGPIFRTKTMLGSDLIYMVGPEANRLMLAGSRQKFSHRVGWGQLLGVIDVYGDGLLTMDGPRHDEHRRVMNPAFAISYMDRYLPLMQRIIRERTADWLARGEVDIYEEARKITFDVAAEALVGFRTGPEVDQFRDLFFRLLTLGENVASEQEYMERMAVLQAELHGMLLPKIRERRAHPTDDVLGLLVQARDEHGQALSDAQLIAHTNILLLAGHETSTSLSAWLLALLAQHPDYMARVLAEQDALLGTRDEPALDEIKRMKVLENALSEAERLFPPVAEGPRGVLEPFEFGGYEVPAGVYAMYSIVASHMLPSVFAEPARFDPDRFAAPREEHKRTPYALVGFGGGPRICIGINFAQVEIKALASHVLRRYRLELAPGQPLLQVYRPTGAPLAGVRMRVAPRERQ
jgi:cytochrome P450